MKVFKMFKSEWQIISEGKTSFSFDGLKLKTVRKEGNLVVVSCDERDLEYLADFLSWARGE